ncbi:MAG: hypothetical protein JWQ71_2706 [Pedosphaera sp.]|nr:hypothetical protein [Pedosphaera sp.]
MRKLTGKQIISRALGTVWMLLVIVSVSSCSKPPAPASEKSASQKQEAASKRAKWRLATLLGEYERAGQKNPKWDEDAKAALESFATMDLDDWQERREDLRRTARYTESAVVNGCNDPLIQYFYFRTAYDSSKHTTNENIQAYVKAGDDLSQSGYCEIRKFYGCLRTALAIYDIDTKNQDYYRLRGISKVHLAAALEDKEFPPEESAEACIQLLNATENNSKEYPQAYQAIAGPLSRNFSKTFVPYLIQGHYYVGLAWKARGSDWANTVTADGWKAFSNHLATAESALKEGWKVDPTDWHIPTEMLRVELGQGKGPKNLELWFERAMKTNPKNREACLKKLYYLYPRWHGSYEEMRAFGYQCMTNQNYQANVTLVLVDAHQKIADDSKMGRDYWNRPGVWEDVHDAFEEFFRRNPDADGFRYNYVWYANACGHSEAIAKQLPYLKEPVDYDYFGGKEKFEAMKAKALATAKK